MYTCHLEPPTINSKGQIAIKGIWLPNFLPKRTQLTSPYNWGSAFGAPNLFELIFGLISSQNRHHLATATNRWYQVNAPPLLARFNLWPLRKTEDSTSCKGVNHVWCEVWMSFSHPCRQAVQPPSARETTTPCKATQAWCSSDRPVTTRTDLLCFEFGIPT